MPFVTYQAAFLSKKAVKLRYYTAKHFNKRIGSVALLTIFAAFTTQTQLFF
jgi:hypothetical protein